MKKLFVANWKQYISYNEAIALAEDLIDIESEKFSVVIAPQHIALSSIASMDAMFSLCAQDCFWEKSGAFTGVVSVADLKAIGVSYVIIGHSERRKYFNETDEIAAKKVKASIDAGLTPILCVGESRDEFETGQTMKVLEKQLSVSLSLLNVRDIDDVIIAYEPIWAISGFGGVKANDACETEKTIKWIKDNFGEAKVLYGGSVNHENISEIVNLDSCDGVLVGFSSVNIDSFRKMIQ